MPSNQIEVRHYEEREIKADQDFDTSQDRCGDQDVVWSRRCEQPIGHDGVHVNNLPGDRLTWGTAAQVRAYEGLDR